MVLGLRIVGVYLLFSSFSERSEAGNCLDTLAASTYILFILFAGYSVLRRRNRDSLLDSIVPVHDICDTVYPAQSHQVSSVGSALGPDSFFICHTGNTA